MAEVSDAELAELRGAHRLLDAALKSPDTRTDAHKILKKLNPKASIPEFDIQQGVEAKYADLEKKFAALETKLADKEEMGAYSAEFDKAAQKHGVTVDGRAKVLELMTERKIRDPEAGILLFNELNPPPAPVTTSGWAGASVFDSVPDDEMKGWFENTGKRRDEEIRAVLNEFKTA